MKTNQRKHKKLSVFLVSLIVAVVSFASLLNLNSATVFAANEVTTGTLALSGGSSYTGEISNGLPHGYGRLNLIEEGIYKGYYAGNWINGVMHGEGCLGLADGTTVEGIWINGIMDGTYIHTEPNGKKYETIYKNDELISAVEITESSSDSSNTDSESSSPTIKWTEGTKTVYAKQTVIIREKPSKSSEKVGTLKKGASIVRTAVSNTGWAKVTYNGKTAYINRDYLSATKPVIWTTGKKTVYAKQTVNIREKPSKSSEKIGSLKKGASIVRTAVSNTGWAKVTYNGKTAYIVNDYLTTSITPKWTKENKMVYAKSNVYIRQSPSTSAKSIGTLKKDKCIARYSTSNTGWSKVAYKGKTAYINSSYLTTQKPTVKVNITGPTLPNFLTFCKKAGCLDKKTSNSDNTLLEYTVNMSFSVFEDYLELLKKYGFKLSDSYSSSQHNLYYYAFDYVGEGSVGTFDADISSYMLDASGTALYIEAFTGTSSGSTMIKIQYGKGIAYKDTGDRTSVSIPLMDNNFFTGSMPDDPTLPNFLKYCKSSGYLSSSEGNKKIYKFKPNMAMFKEYIKLVENYGFRLKDSYADTKYNLYDYVFVYVGEGKIKTFNADAGLYVDGSNAALHIKIYTGASSGNALVTLQYAGGITYKDTGERTSKNPTTLKKDVNSSSSSGSSGSSSGSTSSGSSTWTQPSNKKEDCPYCVGGKKECKICDGNGGKYKTDYAPNYSGTGSKPYTYWDPCIYCSGGYTKCGCNNGYKW